MNRERERLKLRERRERKSVGRGKSSRLYILTSKGKSQVDRNWQKIINLNYFINLIFPNNFSLRGL